MTGDPVFTGFTRGTVRFFTFLRKDNNREWFLRNRPAYEEHVLAPAKLSSPPWA